MTRNILLPALLLGVAFVATPAFAQRSGSYMQSCTAAAMDGDLIVAACPDAAGTLRAARIDPRSCSGDISNQNGTLVCGGGGGGPPPQQRAAPPPAQPRAAAPPQERRQQPQEERRDWRDGPERGQMRGQERGQERGQARGQERGQERGFGREMDEPRYGRDGRDRFDERRGFDDRRGYEQRGRYDERRRYRDEDDDEFDAPPRRRY